MSFKRVLISDVSGAEIPEGRGATVRVQFADRDEVRVLHLTNEEAETMGGSIQKKRGRKPKTAVLPTAKK